MCFEEVFDVDFAVWVGGCGGRCGDVAALVGGADGLGESSAFCGWAGVGWRLRLRLLALF